MNKNIRYILLNGAIYVYGAQAPFIAQESNLPKIKLIKEVFYEVENNILKNRDSLLSLKIDNYLMFDENEKLIESGKYNSKYEFYEKITYERNKNGFSEKGVRKGKLEKVQSLWTYQYDSINNLVEVRTYDSQNNLINTQFNKYDRKGNHTQMLLVNHNQQTVWKYIYRYNDIGQKIEELKYKPNGGLKNRQIYSYDRRGNESEQIKSNVNGSYTKIISVYNNQDDLIFQDWYNDKNEKTYPRII